MIYIRTATSKKEIAQFIDFPHELYKNDPNYVPELHIAQRDLLTKHPFHKHSEVALFLAYRNNRISGRIAAILNRNHNNFNIANDGFFGFFDCEDDFETASALLDQARAWLREHHVDTMIGPVNFSTNETCGVLLEGYDSPPVVMMPYNKSYYPGLFSRYGFGKKTDLVAYLVEAGEENDRSVKMKDLLEKRLAEKQIVIRPINMKDFWNEVEKIKQVYNSAWDKNLGFVPMTDEEFTFLANDLKLLLDPDFCQLAEHNGKVVGFSLAIPDINQVLIGIKKGRLFPTGLIRLLWNKKKINRVRVITLGVVEGYRKLGIEACFYARIIADCHRKKITSAEASWVLEDNELMNRGIQGVNGKAYKKYRIYEMPLVSRPVNTI